MYGNEIPISASQQNRLWLMNQKLLYIFWYSTVMSSPFVVTICNVFFAQIYFLPYYWQSLVFIFLPVIYIVFIQPGTMLYLNYFHSITISLLAHSFLLLINSWWVHICSFFCHRIVHRHSTSFQSDMVSSISTPSPHFHILHIIICLNWMKI